MVITCKAKSLLLSGIFCKLYEYGDVHETASRDVVNIGKTKIWCQKGV